MLRFKYRAAVNGVYQFWSDAARGQTCDLLRWLRTSAYKFLTDQKLLIKPSLMVFEMFSSVLVMFIYLQKCAILNYWSMCFCSRTLNGKYSLC